MSRHFVVRVSDGGPSVRLPRRVVTACAVAAALLVAFTVLTLSYGETVFSPAEVLHALFSHSQTFARLLIVEVRLPRVLLALLVGIALGLSGAIFQSLAQNPLVSPDVIGINSGASLAVVMMLYYAGGATERFIPLAAFGGGMAAAATVYLLSLAGGLSRYRLILMGIGMNALFGSAISYYLWRVNSQPNGVSKRLTAQVWMAGSVSNADRWLVEIIVAALIVLVPLAILVARALAPLQLGDESAAALGVAVARVRACLLVVGVGLAAVAVSVAGPVGLLAFIAPHIARRLGRSSGPALLPLAALTGAVIMVIADYVGRRAFEPIDLPVGLTTTLIGAPYFLYLLLRADRLGAGV